MKVMKPVLAMIVFFMSLSSYAATVTFTNDCPMRSEKIVAGLSGEIYQIDFLDEAGLEKHKIHPFYKEQYRNGIRILFTEGNSMHFINFPYGKESPSELLKEIAMKVKTEGANLSITCSKIPYSDRIRIAE